MFTFSAHVPPIWQMGRLSVSSKYRQARDGIIQCWESLVWQREVFCVREDEATERSTMVDDAYWPVSAWSDVVWWELTSLGAAVSTCLRVWKTSIHLINQTRQLIVYKYLPPAGYISDYTTFNITKLYMINSINYIIYLLNDYFLLYSSIEFHIVMDFINSKSSTI